MVRGKTIVKNLMAECVNLGNELVSRSEVYRRLATWTDPQAAKRADYFAFATRSVPAEEQTHFAVRCACGCRWLGPEMGVATCPTCEEG